MKRIFYSLLFVFSILISSAQKEKTPDAYFLLRGTFLFPTENSIVINVRDSIEFPKYNGQLSDLYRTLMQTTTSLRTIQKNMCGFVRCIVFYNADGKIDSASVVSKIGNFTGQIEEEAIAAIKKTNSWLPFRINGISQPFSIRISVPVGNKFHTISEGKPSTIGFVFIERETKGLNENITCASYDLDDIDRIMYYEQANGFLREGKYYEAIEKYSIAILINSKDIDALFNRAAAYSKSGNKEKACEDWKRASELGDKEAKGLFEKNCK
jgi:tetratricopeptide (TPR) repeat protein